MKTFKTSHTFENMTNWSHDLNQWVSRFKASNGVYPNILLASGRTYSKIDLVANSNSRHRIKGESGDIPANPVALTGFQGPGYDLHFCLDDDLETNQIKLIFDHGSGGGGEDIEGLDVAI